MIIYVAIINVLGYAYLYCQETFLACNLLLDGRFQFIVQRCLYRMSRLSLKKRRNADKQPPCINVPQIDPNDIIEISDDESDTSQACEIITTDAKSKVSSENISVSQEDFTCLFQKSTDSIDTDDSMGTSASSSAPVKHNPALFTWHSYNKNDKKDTGEVQYDSDSSKESHFESGLSHRKQRRR